MTMCELRLATLVDLHNIYTCILVPYLCSWLLDHNQTLCVWHYGQFGFDGMSIQIGSEIFKFQMVLKFEVTTNVNIV